MRISPPLGCLRKRVTSETYRDSWTLDILPFSLDSDHLDLRYRIAQRDVISHPVVDVNVNGSQHIKDRQLLFPV
jgi:hypothetical protein